MTNDNLYTKEDGRKRLISGIKKCANAVGITMGTAGSNSIIEAMEQPGHLTTNDGATILGAIRLGDPIEEMGRKILLEAVSRANKSSGDGSSTTCVLTAAIIEEGQKVLNPTRRYPGGSGGGWWYNDPEPIVPSAIDVKRSLEACIPLIEKALKEQSKPIGVYDVSTVATISAEDEQIGNTIQQIYQEIGKDGIIHWDISKTDKDTYTLGNGITVEGAGYASPYMCDMDDKTGALLNVARWKSPKVLITKEKIGTAAIFEKLFVELNAKAEREVVIFCEDIEPTVIPQLVQTRIVQGFKTIVIKMPVLWKDEWYEDLALASGATIIDPAAGLPLKDAKPEHLGTFGHITVDKDATYIDGITDLTAHIESLTAKADDGSKIRAARLNTRTARYFVGAPSDSALSYRRLKVEDAISAAWQALHGGVVVGGGVALYNVAEKLPACGNAASLGGRILRVALQAPMRQIVKNSGEFTNNKVGDNTVLGGNYGWNSKTQKVEDLVAAGVVDPTNIVLNAATQAISVAASVLAVETVVTLPRQLMLQNGAPQVVI